MTNLHAKAVAIREPYLQSYGYVRSDGQVSFTLLPAPTEPVAAQVVTLVGASGAKDRVAANPAIGSGDAEAAQGVSDNPYEFTQYGDPFLKYIENFITASITKRGSIRGFGVDGNRYQLRIEIHPEKNQGKSSLHIRPHWHLEQRLHGDWVIVDQGPYYLF